MTENGQMADEHKLSRLYLIKRIVHYTVRGTAVWRGELTFHVHVRRFIHEMHKELSGVDEDLVSTVADRAIPPRALR